MKNSKDTIAAQIVGVAGILPPYGRREREGRFETTFWKQDSLALKTIFA